LSPDPSHRSSASPVIEREALDYLNREIRPAVGRGENPVLKRAISSAVRAGSVVPLGHLAERHRRELLDTIDGRFGRGRRAPTPRALVYLTGLLAALPEPAALRAGSPAR
jgi:hypothetical protein